MMLQFRTESVVLQVAKNLQNNNSQKLSHLEKLSSGLRINKSYDDPSGLAISSGMQARLRGTNTSIQNVLDGISLVTTADTVLGEVQDTLLRIRDLAVKGANSATQSVTVGLPGDDPTCDVRTIVKEIMMLQTEIYRKAQSVTFNGKLVFHVFAAPNGEEIQLGPDSDSSQRITVTVPDLEGYGIPYYEPPPGNLSAQAYTAAFRSVIENATTRLGELADARADLGSVNKRLNSILNSLNSDVINLTESKSRITDTNYAEEITNYVKTQALDNTISLAFSTAMPDKQSAFILLNSAGLDGTHKSVR